MARARNEAFVAWMEREGWSAPALAKELDAVVRRLTRRSGPGRELSEITVHKWRSGETSWPQEKYRVALEEVSGLMVADLRRCRLLKIGARTVWLRTRAADWGWWFGCW
ncbi:hypothetical protein ACFRCI_37690 [Streptomyces sp. NPDC056638]|uniref:hypothetical protein n=1 Tax=Streptomyces sp. NPDC056638 TaxID=3345887 RepID=UPI003683C9F4